MIITLNTLRPRQNGRHFPEDIFKCIFLKENVSISIKISLKFDPKGPNNNIPALVQIMAWRRPGDKPLSEPMMVSLPTHICITRTQWVNQMLVSIHLVVLYEKFHIPEKNFPGILSWIKIIDQIITIQYCCWLYFLHENVRLDNCHSILLCVVLWMLYQDCPLSCQYQAIIYLVHWGIKT